MRVASSGTETGGLPAELTSFVGRRHEIAEVKRLLSGSRLVTLVGVGGVGKTRLALRVAADVRRAFPDGVCLVELAALESPELLVRAVTEALKIVDLTPRSPVEVLADRLRDKRMLLVLDNCEHLLHDCTVLAETLVRSAPDLRILATSRQALGAVGEQTMVVPALPLPDRDGARLSTASLQRSDAVRLFAERATAVVPSFAITDGNRDAVARVCRRLDGIPLALELAAVRLRMLSVEQLLERLEDRFGLLTGSRTVLPRQRTLRALIDWSHTLCTEQEQLLWARLSVFAGSLDLEAAEQVCSGEGIAAEEIVDLVIGLVDKSILIREEHRSGVRYRLLDTIRQYGRDRLRESGQEAPLRRRHRDWYHELAIGGSQGWFGPDFQGWFGPQQVTWYQRLRIEHDNLRTALDFCLATRGETQPGLVIATALRYYWIASDSPQEGRSWLDRLLAADPEPTPARARALTLSARLAVLQSDFTVAASLLEEARELGQRFEDPAIKGGAAYVAGLAALLQRDLAGGLVHLETAREFCWVNDDLMGVTNSMIYLATVHSLLGHTARAVKGFEECLAICEPRREHWFRSYTLWTYGIEVWRQGDVERAIAMEREAIRLKEPFDDGLGVALCVEALAWMSSDDARRSAVLLGALREIWRSFGGPLFGYLAEYHDACELAARAELGDRAFEVAFRKGAGLTAAEAVEYAMRDDAQVGEPEPEASPLTPRELEIARLVARGMSNKAIAAALVIAQRTAEGHVEHILSKLGFNSRVQIAAWVSSYDNPENDQSSGSSA
ncbi:ATP-binding protein [Nonomuraea lactucae]|uniref:ATP-binding protein n=1 Tax=Nonomuraea lactucae TaxID=2249762 RepID=UPI000DE55327|nr:LuxR C-terminal-related transcriptional regulator [Nonomuraea lactucae]